MEINPEDKGSDDTGDGYMNTIVSFTSKRIGYLAVFIIIGGCTLWWAEPYASEVFSYKANIDELGKVSDSNGTSLKTLWSEFSSLRSQVATAVLQQQFDEKFAAEPRSADAVRDEKLAEQLRRIEKLETIVERMVEIHEEAAVVQKK